MRESQGKTLALLPSGHPAVHKLHHPVPTAALQQDQQHLPTSPARAFQDVMTVLLNFLQNHMDKQHKSPAPKTTWYFSSYWCECSQSNSRASSACHMMPLQLLQCIRERARRKTVDHVAHAYAPDAGRTVDSGDGREMTVIIHEEVAQVGWNKEIWTAKKIDRIKEIYHLYWVLLIFINQTSPEIYRNQ